MESPYKTIILTGSTLIIVTNQGDTLIKPAATAEDIAVLRTLTTEEEVLDFVTHPDFLRQLKIKREVEAERQRKAQEAQAKLDILVESGWFEVRDNAAYFKGINRSLPPLLVDHFVRVFTKRNNLDPREDADQIRRYDDILLALKRFQMWAFANPRPEVAEELYGFLKNNILRLTKEGLIIALRNVVTVPGIDTSLVSFVSEKFNKMKAAFWLWRKDPTQYNVYKDGSGYRLVSILKEALPHYEYQGNLAHMYHNLPELSQNRFTDWKTKTFDIRVGRKVSMPPEKCSWSTVDCGEAGLHFTMDEIHYVGCGDTSVMVLINPMKIVGIGESKGRCYEYLPFMTVNRSEATEILRNKQFDTLQLDLSYAAEELEGLEETITRGFAVEKEKYTYDINPITPEEVKEIVHQLSDIKGRVINIS